MVNFFLELMNWIYRFLATNFYFIVYSFKGYLLMGIFPALATVYGLCRRWLKGEFPEIKDYFKDEFPQHKKEASILGYAMLGIGILLYINWQIFAAQNSIWGIYLFYFLSLLLLFYLVAQAAIFAIYSEFELERWQYLRIAVVFPLAKIVYAALLGVLLFCLYYLIFLLAFPLGLFIGVPAFALLSTIICRFSWRQDLRPDEQK